MRYSKLIVATVLGALGVQMAAATPTPEEAAQLGKSLTAYGAIKAGNKEGTIPEYTGGICTPPAGYKPIKGDQGGAPYINPFAADKPLFRITAADVAKYADKLDEGTKEMFRRNPQSFYIDVYPTRRSACFPDYVNENTIKRVMNPKIVGGDVPSLAGAHAQLPFPIPKNGNEAIWNALVRYSLPRYEGYSTSWLVDSSGRVIHQNSFVVYQDKPYWDNSLASLPDDKPFWTYISAAYAPASQAGTMNNRWYYLRPDLSGQKMWVYTPGQRRVRMSPETAYDGVSVSSAGILLFDEINGFDGKMDKFDFKLLGRKEMYIPYNSYESIMRGAEVNGPHHADPKFMRYELHRVWHVEATLKPGERHVQQKKVFYLDEDSWVINIFNGIDHSGKVDHLITFTPYQAYDRPGIEGAENFLYDFTRRAYLRGAHATGIGPQGENLHGNIKMPPYSPNYFTPEAMAGRGVR